MRIHVPEKGNTPDYTDIDYWYDKYLSFETELEQDRIQSQERFIRDHQSDLPGELSSIIQAMKEDLATPRPLKDKKAFTKWWLSKALNHVRPKLMDDYEIGLKAYVAKYRDAVADAIKGKSNSQ